MIITGNHMDVKRCKEGRETDAGIYCIVILGHTRGEVVGERQSTHITK